MSLLVGKKAPSFSGTALIGGDISNLGPENAFKNINNEEFLGKWVCLFFYPLDFSLVCPTELIEFGNDYEEFKKLNCELISVSTDSQYSHLAWRASHPNLKNLPYFMLSDLTKNISRNFEILKEETGYALRGLYLIDPDGIIKYSVIQTEAIGRSSKETLRILKALQSGKFIPCNWEEGKETL